MKAVVLQVQTRPDPRLQFEYQRMPMTEAFRRAMYGIGQEIAVPGKLSLKGVPLRGPRSGGSENTANVLSPLTAAP